MLKALLYRSTARISKLDRNFSKIPSNIKKILYASYYPTVNNERGVGILRKYKIFRNFGLKFKKNNPSKIALHFLVEDANPFHLICGLIFCQ